ncbi:MAG: M20 family metallopeptidase [Verrucomicrobiota bacterium]|nr:M20 family metallopeptidase [Verrucomicrobiota bacterium]
MSMVVKLLRDLIAIPSINNAFLVNNNKLTGEERVAKYIIERANKAKLDIQKQPTECGRDNLIIRLSPKGKIKHRVILAPHLDTVGVEDTSGLKPKKKGDRIYGRGACDTKGSVAVMFNAIEELAKNRGRPTNTEIVFIGFVDEECDQTGSRAFANLHMKADLALVGEPTRCRVVTAHKGDFWLRIQTKGKAAHGARPELGDNAAHTMAKCIDIIETKYASSLRRRTHPTLGCPTINTGTIKCGLQPNIVPDSCEARLDRRTLPGETFTSIHKEIKLLLKKNKLNANISNIKKFACPAMETNPRSPWVSAFMRTARQSKAIGVDYYCDAANIAATGVPTIVWGPGDIAQAHTVNEWISINQIERGMNLLKRFLLSLP